MSNINRKSEQQQENESTEEVLLQAEKLVLELRQGNDQQVDNILQQISRAKEASLYNEVGKMTRQLHDAIENFRQDARISSLAEEEIPDARARLSHVISMTQQAADKTLNAVENSIPVADRISVKSIELGESWKKFRQRKLSADEFRSLADDIEEFLSKISDDSVLMKNNLNEILMAQGFQDITGQIIRQVITLVEEVEKNMVELVKLTGDRYSNTESETKKEVEMGPNIAGIGNADVMETQDDVDDLLSSLGF